MEQVSLKSFNTEKLYNKSFFELEIPFQINILIARPLKELLQHIKNKKLPSLLLIARSIKVLALAIFRGHLCDHVMISSQNFFTLEKITHSLNGKVTSDEASKFKEKYPFMRECAYLLKTCDNKVMNCFEIEGVQSINPNTIRILILMNSGISIVDKQKSITINDLFQSKLLKLS